MVVKTDQDRIKALLAEAIRVLCKNGLNYKREFSIEGLLGITLDREDVFLVNINETVSPGPEEAPSSPQKEADGHGTSTPKREHPRGHIAPLSPSQDIRVTSERAPPVPISKTVNHMQLPVRTFEQSEAASFSGHLEHSQNRKRRSSERNCRLPQSGTTSQDELEHSGGGRDYVMVKRERLSDSESESVVHMSQPVFREEDSVNSQGEVSDQADLGLSSPVEDEHQQLAGRMVPVSTMWDPSTLGYALPTMAGMAAMAQSFNSSIGAAVLNQELICPVCGKQYAAGLQWKYERHMATHGHRTCELCGMTCKNSQALRAHRYRHNKKLKILTNQSNNT